MLSFLDKQASAATSMESQSKSMDRSSDSRDSRSTQRSTTSNIRSSTPYGKDGKPLRPSANSAPKPDANPKGKPNVKHFPCEACSGDHMVYDCDDYLSLSYNARWAFVRARGLCPNCLKRGHTVDHCFSRTCSNEECKKKDPRHNSTLCPNKVGKKPPSQVRKIDDGKKKSD